MATVFLLFEGDEWLSSDSLILMGVFSSEKKLEKGAKKLIWERRKEHLQYEKDCACEGDDIRGMREICADILNELIRNNQSSCGDIRYQIKEVELDKLEEV
jgi:hypothetical protein